jgi:hypothetical protein
VEPEAPGSPALGAWGNHSSSFSLCFFLHKMNLVLSSMSPLLWKSHLSMTLVMIRVISLLYYLVESVHLKGMAAWFRYRVSSCRWLCGGSQHKRKTRVLQPLVSSPRSYWRKDNGLHSQSLHCLIYTKILKLGPQLGRCSDDLLRRHCSTVSINLHSPTHCLYSTASYITPEWYSISSCPSVLKWSSSSTGNDLLVKCWRTNNRLS